MKRIIFAIGLALLSTAAVTWGVVAQRSVTLAPLAPFLIDIQQTVPVTFTFTVDEQVVTVPTTVDVALTIQVHADGSFSPTVQVGKVTAPVVAVAPIEPAATPSAQTVDANGVLYIADVSAGLVLEQVNSPVMFDRFTVAGIIRNHTTNDLGMFDIRIAITTFDAAGKLLAVNPGWLSMEILRADGVSPFTASTMLDAKGVASYTVQISTK